MVRTEFAHWSIDKPETGQEINEIGTRIICALNFYAKLRLFKFYVPGTIDIAILLEFEGIRFESWPSRIFFPIFSAFLPIFPFFSFSI